jgi:hypothetical protein
VIFFHQAAADIGAHPADPDNPDLHENSLTQLSGAGFKIASQYCSIMHGHAFKKNAAASPCVPEKSWIPA